MLRYVPTLSLSLSFFRCFTLAWGPWPSAHRAEQKHRALVLRGKEGWPPYLQYFLGNHFPPGLRHAELRVGVEKCLDDRGSHRTGLQHLLGSGGRPSSRGLGFGSRWGKGQQMGVCLGLTLVTSWPWDLPMPQAHGQRQP